jgi:glycosyltransferase involved in cell wall biosynthesis
MSLAITEFDGKPSGASNGRHRLAFIVSHPIQYYVPLYQRLAQRSDISIKVFFTWHDGSKLVQDRGFGLPLAWDIPLTQDYEFEAVENISADPGTHHFFGLRNPSLVAKVLAWRPTVIHITGWAWQSHLQAMKSLAQANYPILFRGDSHLLDRPRQGPKWWLKRTILKRVYREPSAFLVTGRANREYYRAFGIEGEKLRPCPHSIDYARFAEPDAQHERQAQQWREELNIRSDQFVFLFAGKFEPRKGPIAFMEAVASLQDPNIVGVMIGDGDLRGEIESFAKSKPRTFRILPFQNQRQMPVVYRLGDVFVMPSSHGETWGLAVNEALACGRPVLVSDKVGCAADVVDEHCGHIFSAGDRTDFADALRDWSRDKARWARARHSASLRARQFDIPQTESALMDAVEYLAGTYSQTR